jgi:repressor LexA
MTSFKDRLKNLRFSSNLTQEELAKRLHLSKSRIGMYETGKRKPDLETAELFADFFNIDMDYLQGRAEIPNAWLAQKNSANGVKIPVLGYVAAGIPIKEIKEIIDYEEIPQSLACTGEFFGLKIKGNSMEPRICNGDIVIVRSQPDIESGDIAIVSVSGEYGTCKRIKKTENGIYLIGLNPSFDPVFYTNADIIKMPITVLGKVVELRAKL